MDSRAQDGSSAQAQGGLLLEEAEVDASKDA